MIREKKVLIFIIGLFFIMISISVWMMVFNHYNDPKIIQEWGRQHNYKIVKIETCWTTLGPFFWRHTKLDRIYYVTYEDADGQKKIYYLRSIWGDKQRP